MAVGALLVILMGLVCMSVVCQKADENLFSFESPKLSEEEMHSNFMPDNLKCDACTAVAYQMTKALKKAEASVKSRKLKESDYTLTFETVCGSKTYENYGLKAVSGVNRLSGPGLDTENIPGMLQGGGKWPGRLSEKCFGFLEQVGEDELYDAFHQLQDVQEILCKEVSSDCKTKAEIDSEKQHRKERVRGPADEDEDSGNGAYGFSREDL